MVDLDAFVADGYVKVEHAVPRAVADAACAVLWEQLGLSPYAPEHWSAPVLWASDLTGAGPFGELVRSPVLARVLDAVCGTGGWYPRGALGNVTVRFPVLPPADDRGWHVDANTPQSDGSWAVTGRPHTVLLLTLLSEVGEADAPTRIRLGSHRDVGAALGPDAVELTAMGRLVDAASARRPVVHRSTGRHVRSASLHRARGRRAPRQHAAVHGSIADHAHEPADAGLAITACPGLPR